MQVVAEGLTKRYGQRRVVNDLSFELEPGKITGFLGPNGSGKSTTMGLMLGLISGSGFTHFDGKTYRSLNAAPRRVGVYLGPGSYHPKYSAKRHLRISAFTRGISFKRIKPVLEIVGLTSARRVKIREMSTGMVQKLGIATAILSEPEVLILDEPANGLDPQSVQWLRLFLQDFAQKGGTVLLSSHLIHEISLFADNILVIAQGQILASESMDTFLKRQTPAGYKVRTEQSAVFIEILQAQEIEHKRVSEDVIEVLVSSSLTFTKLAVENNIELAEVQPIGASVEDIFLSLTTSRQDYSAPVPQSHAEVTVKSEADSESQEGEKNA